jgi:hypothetical protein
LIVEQALDQNSFSRWNESPSLVKSVIPFPLVDLNAFLGRSSRDVNCFSWSFVDDQSAFSNNLVLYHVHGLESEHLGISVLLERFVSQASFKFKSFTAFGIGREVEILILKSGCGLEREELVTFLFSRV